MKNKLQILFGCIFALISGSIFSQPNLQITDISYPHTLVLNVGNVGEFVYAITNNGIGSKIDSIFFTVEGMPNIEFYPLGVDSSIFYLTDTADVLHQYNTKYTYPFPFTNSHHNSYPLNLSVLNKIDTAMLRKVLGIAYLSPSDTLFLHIPFFVKNCNDSSGFNKFCLDTTGTYVDTISENVTVGVDVATPTLLVYLDTALMDTSRGSFCPAVHRDSAQLKFTYYNSGTPNPSGPPGNARADSLRIYLYSYDTLAWIDTSTIMINGIHISSPYVTYYVSSPYNIYLIDLTMYPAGSTGHPFGYNTICDMNGEGFADGLAEGDSAIITATLIYDTLTCPPFQQIGTYADHSGFTVVAIWAENNDMCSLGQYYRNPLLSADTLQWLYDKLFNFYYYESSASSINAPTDILGSFNLTVCPVFYQIWQPENFNFYCPNGYWDLVVPLPKGYHLDTLATSLTWLSFSNDSNYTSSYHYYPPMYDSSLCGHDTLTLNHPLIFEHFITPDSTQGTVYINFGQLPMNECYGYSETNIPSCINIPLFLDCAQIPDNVINIDNYGELSYQMEYVCDSGCNSCLNILAADSIQVYYHCLGYCQQPPFTDTAWTFLRTNIGDSNVRPPSYYSTCNSPIYPDSLFKVQDTLPLNYYAAYPGDQVEAQVNGGYNFVPSVYENAYLQIRYTPPAGSPLYSFQLDPTTPSYFIIQGCTYIPSLNGDTLILPASSTINYGGTGSPVEMDFSIDSAIYNYSHTLYSAWMSDPNTESINVSAYIHLRVTSFSASSPEVNQLTLRTEYMCKINGADSSADTVHSCDSWGTRFDIYQPGKPFVGIAGYNPRFTNCDSLTLQFTFDPQGALNNITRGDDFPNEFRPFTELDSMVIFYLPKGYVYSSSQFIAALDRFDNNPSNNYFRGGLTVDTMPIQVYSRTNTGNDPNLPTEIVFWGLDSAHRCWPVIDQKSDSLGNYSQFIIQVNVKPICNAPSFDTIYTVAGYVQGTQQSDTSFQQRVISDTSLILEHVNPVTYLNIPPTTSDSSNLISFQFNVCTLGSIDATVPWVAFENVDGFLFNMGSAVLRDSTTHVTYPGTVYYNGSNEGVIFNLGDIAGSSCNMVVFSALIDPNSKSCPPPTGGDSGFVVVRFGNICSGHLSTPDSASPCQYDSTQFYYHVYPAELTITNNGYSPDTLSLCGGLLTDSLTIASNELGTISDPTFWVNNTSGFTFDSIRFTYPCGGRWDTVLYVPDTFKLIGSGEIIAYGYVLNKDLHIHGLRGTLHSPSVAGLDSNTVCVKFYLTATCGYNGTDSITAYTRGITTCSDTVTVHTSFVPVVDPSCCGVCYVKSDYDLILANDTASVVHAGTTTYYCRNILIIGSYTVDEQVNWSSCNVAFAPNAIVNVLNKGFLNIDPTLTCHPEHICSHLYAACDTMWRGMFIQPGGRVNIIKDALVEDADSAIVSINNSKQQGAYKCINAVFNKNYTDIVVEPFNGYDSSYAQSCLFTCRDFTDIPLCMYQEYYHEAEHTTLKYPFTGQISWMGWDIDSVYKFFDNPVLYLVGGSNTFDNLTNGIYAQYTNMEICADTFQDIRSGNVFYPAISSYGGSGRTFYNLAVGNFNGQGEPNYFHNCTSGIMANGYFSHVNASHNIMDSMNGSNSYGIIIRGTKPAGAIVTIDSNSIDSAKIGIVCSMNMFVNAQIRNNFIEGTNLCSPVQQQGIRLHELGSPTAIYSMKNNTIKNLHYGIYANDVVSDTIYQDTISLGGDTNCSNPTAKAIYINSGSQAQIVANTLSMPYHGISSDYSGTNFTGIYVANSPNCHITCNNTYYFTTAINCTGAGDAGTTFDVLGNSMTAGPNTLNSLGIYLQNASVIGVQGLVTAPSDNQWMDIFTCRSWAPSPTINVLSPFHVRTGITFDPNGGACSPQIISMPASGSIYPCAGIPPVILKEAVLDSIAKNQITYLQCPDTTARLAKHALTTILWNNHSLLSSSLFHNFNDSMNNVSLGQLMIIDTNITSTSSIDPSILLSNVLTITPASNIEINLQTSAQTYLQAVIANNTLSQSQLTAMRTLANLCPYTDGPGVYQARTLLDYYDTAFTVYDNDDCLNDNNRRPVKKTVNNTPDTTKDIAFNLYPNPNNGNFILSYDLGNEGNGRVEMYNAIGMLVAEYILPSSSGTMPVSNPNLKQGVYIYKLYSNSDIKKIGKLIIIR